MNSRAKKVEYKVCSFCGKEYREQYGSYFSGSVDFVSVCSTHEYSTKEFHCCSNCCEKVHSMPFREMMNNLKYNSKV